MAILLVEYRTPDFEGWKEVFDRDPMDRQGSGVTRHWIYRDADDPNHVILSLEFASAQAARTFLDLLESGQGGLRRGRGLGPGGGRGGLELSPAAC
jgi:hypothetical protein